MTKKPATTTTSSDPADDIVETEGRQQAGIQSVEVGFELLTALAKAAGPINLKDLALSAGMSAAKAHRYLVSFQRMGLVQQDASTSRYDLGPAALHLGLAALARQDPVRLARQRIAELADACGQTVALAVWGNRGPTIVHWEESRQPISVHLRLGDVMPLISSATGRCFAAWLPPSSVADLWASEVQEARREGRRDLPLSESTWQQTLKDVRAQGCAWVQHTLLPGVAAMAHPVLDASTHVRLVLVTLGHAAQIDVRPGSPGELMARRWALQLSADLGDDGARAKLEAMG